MSRQTRNLLIAAAILVLLALIFRAHIIDFWYQLTIPIYLAD